MSNITHVCICVFALQPSNQSFNLALLCIFFQLVHGSTNQKRKKIAEARQCRPTNTKFLHAITSLSPVKRERNASYFDGVLADDTSNIRFVGFKPIQQRKLVNFHVPVKIEDCEIKSAQHGDGYKVILKSTSQIKQSPKKIRCLCPEAIKSRNCFSRRNVYCGQLCKGECLHQSD